MHSLTLLLFKKSEEWHTRNVFHKTHSTSNTCLCQAVLPMTIDYSKWTESSYASWTPMRHVLTEHLIFLHSLSPIHPGWLTFLWSCNFMCSVVPGCKNTPHCHIHELLLGGKNFSKCCIFFGKLDRDIESGGKAIVYSRAL